MKTTDNNQQMGSGIASGSNLLTTEDIERLFAEVQHNESQGDHRSPLSSVRHTWDTESMESVTPQEFNLLTAEEIEGLLA